MVLYNQVKNKKPLVSVVMPTFNRANYIIQSVKSVLNQTYKNIELIIIDDGSSDNTQQVVSSINDPRIKYIKNDSNFGIQKSLNKAIKSARGEYIARIDDQDEWIDENKLLKQVDFVTLNPQCVLVGTGIEMVDERGSVLNRYFLPESDSEIRKMILGKNVFIHPSVLFSKRAAEKIGLYSEDKEMRHVEDGDLWLKLGTIGKMHNLRAISVRYVVDSNGISSKNRVEQMKKNLTLIKKYKNNYPGYIKARIRHIVRMVIYGYLNLKIFTKLTSKL